MKKTRNHGKEKVRKKIKKEKTEVHTSESRRDTPYLDLCTKCKNLNLSYHSNATACPNCGSDEIISIKSSSTTGKYEFK